ncbi:MAG: hypothetical protein WCK77_19740 [Verrucomicrobiota bacterium]
MEANGWEKLGGGKYRHIETGAVISDARPPNVIHDAEGNVWPFDVVVHDTGHNETKTRREALDEARTKTDPIIGVLFSSPEPNESPKYDAEKIKEATAAARDEVAATPPDKLRAIGKAWLEIGKRDDAHQLGKRLTSTTIHGLIGQLPEGFTGIKIKGNGTDSHGVKRWDVTAPKGRATITEEKGRVWVDVSGIGGPASYIEPARREAAGAGPVIYQVAQAYARNIGAEFIADPTGVTTIATPRRWSQMLSSATRFQDTAHIMPDGEAPGHPAIPLANGTTAPSITDFPGWSGGKDIPADVGRLAMAEYAYVKKWFPEIESLRISPDGTTILGSDGHPLGTNPGRAFEGLLSGGRDPRVTGIGERTLLRALITRLEKDGESPDFSRSALVSLDDGGLSLFGEDSNGGNASGPIQRSRESGNESGRDLATGALYSSPEPNDSKPDAQPALFAAANAPDAREKLGEVRAGSFKREKAAILATAPRGKDGPTLAHNGERSNLSEDQWATVRTGKFKKYFGDWVSIAAKKALDMSVETRITGNEIADFSNLKKDDKLAPYRAQAKNWAKSNLPLDVTNKLTRMKIEVRPSGVDSTLEHGSGPHKIQSVAALPDLLERAVLLESGPDPDGRPLTAHVFGAKLSIGNSRFVARLVVREDRNGKLFYDHELTTIKSLDALSESGGSTHREVGQSGAHQGEPNILQRIFAVNPESVSKVVDANGEPLPVWHGTNAEFDTFDPNLVGKVFGYDTKGFFFSSLESDAMDYAKNAARRDGGTARTIPVFLDIKKPYDYAEHANEYGDADTAEKGMDGRLLIDWADMYRRDHLKTAEEMGKDGLSIERGKEGLYTAFDPSQIKSATDNNGEFSENPSILRSSAEPGRGRPKSMVEFKKPFRGPSGAAMVAYEWMHEMKEGVDKRGEDKVERVSDWNKAATNWQTGREIVHHFHVDTPDGKTHVVSLESALKLLGYTQANGIGARPVKALASMVKTRATLTMEADALRPVVAEQSATNQRFQTERAALRNTPMPQPVFKVENGTPKMLVDGEMERFGHWANKEAFEASSDRDKRDLADRWRDREAAKRAGGNGWGNESSKLSDLEDRIAKMDRKIQEQSAAGANTPLDPAAITREEYQDAAAASGATAQPDLFAALLKEPPGPLAEVKQRAQAAHNAQPEGSKARENIAAQMAQREGRTGAPAFKAGQGVMDFGAGGGGGKKGQQEFGLMASPQPNQRAFDFGTTSSFATKNQAGFDFTARKVEDAAKETDANPTPAQIEAGNPGHPLETSRACFGRSMPSTRKTCPRWWTRTANQKWCGTAPMRSLTSAQGKRISLGAAPPSRRDSVDFGDNHLFLLDPLHGRDALAGDLGRVPDGLAGAQLFHHVPVVCEEVRPFEPTAPRSAKCLALPAGSGQA